MADEKEIGQTPLTLEERVVELERLVDWFIEHYPPIPFNGYLPAPPERVKATLRKTARCQARARNLAQCTQPLGHFGPHVSEVGSVIHTWPLGGDE